jgi:hypothetical protein
MRRFFTGRTTSPSWHKNRNTAQIPPRRVMSRTRRRVPIDTRITIVGHALAAWGTAQEQRSDVWQGLGPETRNLWQRAR